MLHTTAPHPWYREPMVWLAFAIPLATIPAGLATWWIAAQGDLGTASVDDGSRRIGQMQLADVSEDRAAARLGLSADGAISADRTRVEVQLSAEQTGVALTLELRHPIDPARDQSAPMEAIGNRRFVAHLAPLGRNVWSVRLRTDAGWRLSGSLGPDRDRFDLLPAVAAD